MMIKRMLALVLISSCLFIFATGGSCDRTELTGEVIVEDTRVELGQEVPLQLEVPEELEEIYRVFWEIEPSESGRIVDGAELLETYSDEQLK